jgi:sugar phosphate isomerase/epimerase
MPYRVEVIMERSPVEIACSTIGFGMVPLDTALGHIAARGFTTVEVGVLGDFCPHLDPLAPVKETASRCAEILASHGVRPIALNSAPRIYVADAHDVRQLSAVADRLVALAGELGCDLILDVGERENDPEAGLRRAAEVARGAFRLGRDHHGVTVSVEAPHRGSNAETIPEALHLLDVIGEDGIGITYDTSHATSGGVSAPDGLAQIGDRVIRVQARDHRGDDIHLTPGDGDYDWPALAAFLATAPRPLCLELEFDGALTVEQVAAESGRGREFLRRLVG